MNGRTKKCMEWYSVGRSGDIEKQITKLKILASEKDTNAGKGMCRGKAHIWDGEKDNTWIRQGKR